MVQMKVIGYEQFFILLIYENKESSQIRNGLTCKVIADNEIAFEGSGSIWSGIGS